MDDARRTAGELAVRDDADRFDDVVFAIAAPELARMDAQQRELLTITSEALRSSGARPFRFRRNRSARADRAYRDLEHGPPTRLGATPQGVSPFTATEVR